MSSLDLSAYPSGTGDVLAALAEREARDRQSAVPVTLLAACTPLDRATATARCKLLAGDGHIEEVSWTEDDETLTGYYITDFRVLERGRERTREQLR